MNQTQLDLQQMRLTGDDTAATAIDELRHSYPEIGFVFDYILELRDACDQLADENRALLGRVADLEDPQ